MRIFKHINYVALAAEMLNIEVGSTVLDTQGNLIEHPEPYPRMIIDSIIYDIKCATGTIWYVKNIDEDLLVTSLINLEQKIPKNINHIYHTITSTQHTNLKIKSSMQKTLTTDCKSRNNIKRLFIKSSDIETKKKNKMIARFTWIFEPFNCFDLKLFDKMNYDKYAELIIRTHISSLVIDSDNILQLEHNSYIDELTSEMFTNYKNVVKENDKVESICTHLGLFDKLLNFELSEYWRNYRGYNLTFYNLQREISVCSYENIKDWLENDKCSQCQSTLFDDNYVIMDAKRVVCPICIHFNYLSITADINDGQLFRVKYPKTVYDMINSSNSCEKKKEVMCDIVSGRCQFIDNHYMETPTCILFTDLCTYLFDKRFIASEKSAIKLK